MLRRRWPLAAALFAVHGSSATVSRGSASGMPITTPHAADGQRRSTIDRTTPDEEVPLFTQDGDKLRGGARHDGSSEPTFVIANRSLPIGRLLWRTSSSPSLSSNPPDSPGPPFFTSGYIKQLATGMSGRLQAIEEETGVIATLPLRNFRQPHVITKLMAQTAVDHSAIGPLRVRFRLSFAPRTATSPSSMLTATQQSIAAVEHSESRRKRVFEL